MNLVSLFIAWFITSISLLIISKLPTGVEIDGFQKAIALGVLLTVV